MCTNRLPLLKLRLLARSLRCHSRSCLLSLKWSSQFQQTISQKMQVSVRCSRAFPPHSIKLSGLPSSVREQKQFSRCLLFCLTHMSPIAIATLFPVFCQSISELLYRLFWHGRYSWVGITFGSLILYPGAMQWVCLDTVVCMVIILPPHAIIIFGTSGTQVVCLLIG